MSCKVLKELTDRMFRKMSSDITGLKEGLDPENIALWYNKVIEEAKEMAPPWFVDKIGVKQDPILYLKFNLNISKRAVRYLMMAISNNLDDMPYTTRLYFLGAGISKPRNGQVSCLKLLFCYFHNVFVNFGLCDFICSINYRLDEICKRFCLKPVLEKYAVSRLVF